MPKNNKNNDKDIKIFLRDETFHPLLCRRRTSGSKSALWYMYQGEVHAEVGTFQVLKRHDLEV
jgi:hypothetical protein